MITEVIKVEGIDKMSKIVSTSVEETTKVSWIISCFVDYVKIHIGSDEDA